VKLSIAAEAENELIAGARFYAQQSNVELGFAFIAEFERSVEHAPHATKARRTLARHQPSHATSSLSIQHRLLAAS
jgi:hypothetical protein